MEREATSRALRKSFDRLMEQQAVSEGSQSMPIWRSNDKEPKNQGSKRMRPFLSLYSDYRMSL